MKDMEPVIGSSDYGKDEDMAEVLLQHIMLHCFDIIL